MGAPMKTTIEISDAVLTAAKRLAGERGTTLRALVEEGLRGVIRAGGSPPTFVLRDAAVDGHGPDPDVREGDWTRIRALTYEGRGG